MNNSPSPAPHQPRSQKILHPYGNDYTTEQIWKLNSQNRASAKKVFERKEFPQNKD